MILLTISFGKILFGLVCCVIALTVASKGSSRCNHNWILTHTSRILRRHGERALTSYTYRCSTCGRKKTEVS